MKIKSLASAQNGTLSIAETDLIAEGSNKATAFVPHPVIQDSLTNCLEIIEVANELTLGGSIRLMVKNTIRFPRTTLDIASAIRKLEGATDAITVHTVVALPKAVCALLTSDDGDDLTVQGAITYSIARSLSNIAAIVLGTGKVSLTDDTVNAVRLAMLGSASPLRRALAGLNPIDPANGSYGSLT